MSVLNTNVGSQETIRVHVRRLVILLVSSPSGESHGFRLPKANPGYRRRISWDGSRGDMSFLRVRGILASGGRGAASSGIGPEKTLQQPVYCQPEHWVRAWRWSPLNTQRVEDDRVSDRQCAGRNNDFASVADNRIKCRTPALVANGAITVCTSCLGLVLVAVIRG